MPKYTESKYTEPNYIDECMADFKNIPRDEDGFLINPQHWSENCASLLAKEQSLELTPEHWSIINQVREHYLAHEIHLTNRALVNLLKKSLNPDQANSIYLHQLFVKSPARQVALLAGLPKPPFCF